MSSKNNSPSLPSRSLIKERPARSLRLQLMLWYGSLFVVSLFLFALLVQALLSNALYASTDSTINAEVRVALVSINNELQTGTSALPSKLMLPALDDSDDIIGLVIEVQDFQGHTVYTNGTSRVPSVPQSTLQQVQAGQTPDLYFAETNNGEQVRVAAHPICLPTSGNECKQTIGMLLVAKPMHDVRNTLWLLLLLMGGSGLIVLAFSLLGGWIFAGNVLRPLTEIVKTARSIATTAHGTHIGNLSQRVPRPRGKSRDEMVQLIDTFNEMLEALETATQAQHRFVADASHELRAPLTTVQGNLAFLQRHGDDLPENERRTMLNDAHTETLRLARLVDDLLLLARADSESGPWKAFAGDGSKLHLTETAPAHPTEWDRELLQLVRQLRGRLSVEGSKLQLQIGHIEPVRVYTDEETLRRVMLILLDNAIKYTPAQGSITVSLKRLDNEAVLHIQDNGIGIEPEDVPHVFERFFRADRARSRRGTGLGLSIARVLVEKMKGQISVESQPGQGSTFCIRLPLAHQ
jgi:signal transduction histidine kinase